MLCGSEPDWSASEPGADYRVVRFADYDPPEDDRSGGPWPGSDWFCGRHAPPAERAASDGLSLQEALESLQSETL